MNPSAISTTEAVDAVFYYIFGISAVMLVGVSAVMIWFVVKYNRKRHPRPEPSPRHHVLLETAWTVIPTIIVMTMFWYGWEGYTTLRNVPADAMEVQVTGRMWSWTFDYPNGRSSNRLVVPVNRAVKLQITSEDVLHSFYVPSFRIKRDAVPGMTSYVWFRAPEVAEYQVFCAEYCGVGHSSMLAVVDARSQQDFEKWYRQPAIAKPDGRDLLQKHGCTGCHSLDGSKLVGPTLQGIFGHEVTVTTDGKERTLTIDEDYIRRSILQPQADMVKGFPPVMPSFDGKIPEDELGMIIDFLKGPEAGAAEEHLAEKPAGESAKVTDEKEMGQAGAEKERSEEAASKEDSGTGPAGEPEEKPAASTGATGKPQKETADKAAAEAGERLAGEKGCRACHSIDGSRLVGPSFKGLFGRRETVSTDGKERSLTVDAEYIERSIRQPQADIVVGYPPAMPPFTDLSEADMAALIAWMKTLD